MKRKAPGLCLGAWKSEWHIRRSSFCRCWGRCFFSLRLFAAHREVGDYDGDVLVSNFSFFVFTNSQFSTDCHSCPYFDQRASVLALSQDSFHHAAQSDAVEKFRGVMRLRIFCLSVIHLMPEIEMDASFVSGINEIGNLCYIAFNRNIVNYDVLLFSGYSRLWILF